MAASPEPVTCQSARGSPGSVFSHAITLVTGGPHTPAALAGAAPEMNAVTLETSATTTIARPITCRLRLLATVSPSWLTPLTAGAVEGGWGA